MSVFTAKQRAALHIRISRAICWKNAPSTYRDDANRIATAVLDEIEGSQFSAMALRRGTVAIIKSLEEVS